MGARIQLVAKNLAQSVCDCCGSCRLVPSNVVQVSAAIGVDVVAVCFAVSALQLHWGASGTLLCCQLGLFARPAGPAIIGHIPFVLGPFSLSVPAVPLARLLFRLPRLGPLLRCHTLCVPASPGLATLEGPSLERAWRRQGSGQRSSC